VAEIRRLRGEAVANYDSVTTMQGGESIGGLPWTALVRSIYWSTIDDAANVTGRTFYVEAGRIGLYSEMVLERRPVKAGDGQPMSYSCSCRQR